MTSAASGLLACVTLLPTSAVRKVAWGKKDRLTALDRAGVTRAGTRRAAPFRGCIISISTNNDRDTEVDSTHQRRVFHDAWVAEGAGLALSVAHWFRC